MNQPDVTSKDRFLSSRQRYQPIALAEDFSNEEMARDWTLSVDDRAVLDRSQKRFRLYGRFLDDVRELSPRITNYLNHQLELPPSLAVDVPGLYISRPGSETIRSGRPVLLPT